MNIIDPRDIVNEQGADSVTPTSTDITEGSTITVGGSDAISSTEVVWIELPQQTDRTEGVIIDTNDIPPQSTAEVVEELEKKRKKAVAKPKRKRYLRESTIYDYVLSPNDLMIGFLGGNSPHFIFSEINKTDTIKNLHRVIIHGDRLCMSNGFHFDKNGNVLGLNIKKGSKYKKYENEDYQTISTRQFTNDSHIHNLSDPKRLKYFVIDKNKFLASKGQVFSIKAKSDVTYHEILRIKKRTTKRFQQQQEFIERKKAIISSVYDEDKFEMIYYQNFRSTMNAVDMYFRFDDLIIRNSIEMEHKIHCLITKLKGHHDIGAGSSKDMSLFSLMEGIRMKFNPKDARFRYSHSHLSVSSFSTFGGFCMGSEHFLSHLPRRLSELDFESILYGMYDHVAWESLEGGPYTKMENIGKDSYRKVDINHSSMFLSNYSRNLNRQIMRIIREADLTAVMNCFTLVPDQNGDVYYDVDEHEFYKHITAVFDQNWVIRTLNNQGYSAYAYIPGSKQFIFKNDNEYSNEAGWDQMIAKAENNLINILPVYINGEMIHPEIVDKEFEQGDALSHETVCICPDNLYAIMKYFQHKLLKQLKNEQAKERR